MNLRELQTEAHAIAVDKGWYDTERTFGDCIALVHSELSEALEAYRARGLGGWVEPRVVEKDPPPPSWDRSAFTHDVLNKPCGVASELAAAVIRGGGHSHVLRGGLVKSSVKAEQHRAHQRPLRINCTEPVDIRRVDYRLPPTPKPGSSKRAITTRAFGHSLGQIPYVGKTDGRPTTASTWTPPSAPRWST